MNRYHVGTLVRVSVTFKVSGTATDPTTVTVKVKKPNGAKLSYVYGTDPEVVKDATGEYHADVLTTVTGHYHYRWEGTGTAHVAGGKVFYAQDDETD